MTIPQKKPKRRPLHLPGYDYSQPGAYYVTIVTHGRECLFGDVSDGEMRLNELGRIVERVWLELPEHYPHVELGAFGVLPNHAHAVIILKGDQPGAGRLVGAGLRPAPTGSNEGDAGKELCRMANSDYAGIRNKANDDSGREGAGLRPAPTGPNKDGAGPVGTVTGDSDSAGLNTDDAAPVGSVTGDSNSTGLITDDTAKRRQPLSEIVRALKSFSARRINEFRQTPGTPVWQRNYYERVIRDEEEHRLIHLYIEVNPANWAADAENPGG